MDDGKSMMLLQMKAVLSKAPKTINNILIKHSQGIDFNKHQIMFLETSGSVFWTSWYMKIFSDIKIITNVFINV